MGGIYYAMNLMKLAAEAAVEADERRMIGLFVVAGMVALILKGLLIARWFAKRKRLRTKASPRPPR